MIKKKIKRNMVDYKYADSVNSKYLWDKDDLGMVSSFPKSLYKRVDISDFFKVRYLTVILVSHLTVILVSHLNDDLVVFYDSEYYYFKSEKHYILWKLKYGL